MSIRLARIYRIVAFLLIAMMALPALFVGHAAGQGATTTDNVTVSEATGIEIEINEPWQITDQQVFDDTAGTEEALTIQSLYANGNIGFFLGGDAQSSLDGFLVGFDSSATSRTTIDTDYSNGIAWSLDNSVLGDGTEVVVYTEVREDIDPEYVVLSAMLAVPDDFPDEFVSAQESIWIDGFPIFADVDIDDLEETLATGQGSTDDATVVSDATTGSETNQTTGTNPRDHAKLPSDDENASGQRNETETGLSDEEPTAPGTSGTDFTDAGLISDSEYQSPNFDIDVAWGNSWYVNYDDPEAVMADPAGEMDTLTLVWDGDDFALLFIDISDAGGLTPVDFVDYWTSVDYMSDNAAPDAEILLDRARTESGAVVTRDYLDGGDEVIITKEALLLNEGEHLIVMTLIAPPQMYAEIYADAEGDIQIADGPALTTFSARRVERALEP